jgi:glycosylphosphatidylinositol phospholipase D
MLARYGCDRSCPADLDADGRLTVFDFLAFFNLYNTGDLAADFDGDGELTVFDLLAFQTAFDAGCA